MQIWDYLLFIPTLLINFRACANKMRSLIFIPIFILSIVTKFQSKKFYFKNHQNKNFDWSTRFSIYTVHKNIGYTGKTPFWTNYFSIYSQIYANEQRRSKWGFRSRGTCEFHSDAGKLEKVRQIWYQIFIEEWFLRVLVEKRGK